MPRRVPQFVESPLLPRRLPVLLRHSWYALNQAFRRRIASSGLTPDQFTVLRNLHEKPGLTQRELCARMASDPNTVAALTVRMASEGWIKRTACKEDRRANRLWLLPAGTQKFLAVKRIALKLQKEVSGSFDAEQLEVFLENLSRLASACQTALRHSPSGSTSARRRSTSR